jgi:hypothetical protein
MHRPNPPTRLRQLEVPLTIFKGDEFPRVYAVRNQLQPRRPSIRARGLRPVPNRANNAAPRSRCPTFRCGRNGRAGQQPSRMPRRCPRPTIQSAIIRAYGYRTNCEFHFALPRQQSVGTQRIRAFHPRFWQDKMRTPARLQSDFIKLTGQDQVAGSLSS